jgi:hypothetical protein
MKKAFLISVSVLALSAGAAFAQNTQTTYQNGSNPPYSPQVRITWGR